MVGNAHLTEAPSPPAGRAESTGRATSVSEWSIVYVKSGKLVTAFLAAFPTFSPGQA